ncbi:MAG: AbrB/MazE/SpoVT family DNA-binding domain-containing protein [Parcubacteria group bacterium]|nr:AbrB/MazE/SpoVT family DNA-binding domain-containing protein [Parcubacteria group bacterium]
MIQKVLKVGSSAAVTIPKKSLEELGLRIGDNVAVEIDVHKKVVQIIPQHLSKEDEKIAGLTMNFINRYRDDLEALAKE